jgi:3-dehydroquinate dehydratase-2
MKILIVNGPNLNLLGDREPDIYGSATLADLEAGLRQEAQQLSPDITLTFVQSNHEGILIDAIHSGRHTTDGLILNAGGLTHTSIALRDAVAAYPHPMIEVHLSNVHQREAFRHHSYLSPLAQGVICGLGFVGYYAALRWLVEHLN